MSETTDLAEDMRRVEWLAGKTFRWRPPARMRLQLWLGDLAVGGVHFAAEDFRQAIDMAIAHAWETSDV